MDNTASQKNRQVIISGYVYGQPQTEDSAPPALSGIYVDIKGLSSDNVTTDASGGFKSEDLEPGKYTITASDPTHKYYAPSFVIPVQRNVSDIVITMAPAGEWGEKRGQEARRGGLGFYGFVRDEKKKPLSGIEVTIKSLEIDSSKGLVAVLGKATRKLVRGEQKEEEKQFFCRRKQIPPECFLRDEICRTVSIWSRATTIPESTNLFLKILLLKTGILFLFL
jgi:hypothetical protein